MKHQRMHELLDDFSRAHRRLQEALQQDVSQGSIVVDGTIQRFEFSFELAWKLTKAVLCFEGIEALTPRAVIKEAYRVHLISDGDDWIDMLEDRNRTSHVYDEETAMQIYNKIKNKYEPLFGELESSIRDRLS